MSELVGPVLGMSRPRPHVAVVGAGIAGLTAAFRLHTLRPDWEVTLVDAGDRVGGKILTEHVNGFVIDAGPDSLITAKPEGLALMAELGLGEPRPAVEGEGVHVLSRGRLRRLPAGMTAFIPRRAWPLAVSGLLSPWAKLRMALEYVVPARPRPGDESVESFVSRRLGRGAYQGLVEPLVGGIFAADSTRLSLLATLPHLPAAEQQHGGLIRAMLADRRTARRTAGAATPAPRRPGLVAPAGGMGEIVAALMRHLGDVQVLLGSELVGIEQVSEGYLLRIEQGAHRTSLAVHAVVLAVPAQAPATALGDLAPEVAGILRATEYSSTVTVSLGYRSADVPSRFRDRGYVVPSREGRLARACSWPSARFPGRAPEGHVLLRVSLGGAGRQATTGMSDQQLLAAARSELTGTLGVTADPVLASIHRWELVMPQYTVGHRQRMQDVQHLLSAHPGVVTAGSGFHGMSVPDCIGSGQQAARAVIAQLDGNLRSLGRPSSGSGDVRPNQGFQSSPQERRRTQGQRQEGCR